MAKSYLRLPSTYAITTQIIGPKFEAADAAGFSDLIYIGGNSVTAIWFPGSNSGAAWIPADLLVYVCPSDGTQVTPANYSPLYKYTDGSIYVLSCPTSVPAAGYTLLLNPYDFVGFDAIQFKSVVHGTPASAVVQTNSPTIKLFTIGNGTF